MSFKWKSAAVGVLFFVLSGCNLFMDDARIAETDSGTNTEDSGTGTAEDSASSDTGTSSDTGRSSDTGTSSDTGFDSETGTEDVSGPCEGVRCGSPEANQCSGLDGINIFAAVGYCVSGDCQYAQRTEMCESGECSGGVCVENPCQGVTCSTPPAPVCEGDSLRVYAERGFCMQSGQTGTCEYASMLFECASACENGACVDQPCVGVVCDTPPARHCEDGRLYVFDTRGRCVEGECVYASQEVACASGCGEGRCQGDDACKFVTCNDSPANYCVSDTTLRVFETNGGCEAGACYYEHSDLLCENGCQNGRCVGAPCQGVTCDQPPPARCATANSLEIWDGLLGVCVDGMCTYGITSAPCATSCVEGMCEGSVCTGVICNTPFAEYCRDGGLVSYDIPGSCDATGTCTYDEVVLECSDTCDEGSCDVVATQTTMVSTFFNVTSGSGRVSCENYQGWISVGGTLGSGAGQSENYSVKLGVGAGQ